jgi:hypothetical protein
VSCTPTWFWGPLVTLEDCLAAFFAADELKGKSKCHVGFKVLIFPSQKHGIGFKFLLLFAGDNMYSCERCKK